MPPSDSPALPLAAPVRDDAPAPPVLIALLAVAAGLGAANLYYAQPLAATIARSLGAPPSQVAAPLLLTQLGYALGMVLLVPLGDGRERRGVIVATTLASGAALLLAASSRSIPVLAAASLLVGFASSVPQMILPFAVGLAPARDRPRVVGVIMSGLLTGILLSRTASGALGGWLGWRATFVSAAVVMGLLAAVLHATLPLQPPEAPASYGALLRSMAQLARTEPVLRRRALVGALGFAAFSAFWSTLAFHLASPALGYGSTTAGLLGAVGVVGVLVAPVVGRVAPRLGPTRINRIGLVTVAASFAVFALGARSLGAIVAGIVLLDAGVQASHLANQTVIFGLRPELRSRLNAVYMVAYFLGGALGTGAGAAGWSLAGWTGVCVAGAGFALAALLPLRGE